MDEIMREKFTWIDFLIIIIAVENLVEILKGPEREFFSGMSCGSFSLNGSMHMK